MAYIKNSEQLLSKGEVRLRRIALDIAESALTNADPGRAAASIVKLQDNTLTLGPRTFVLAEGQRIFVVGTGKASYPVAKVLDEVLGDRIHAGFVTCKKGQEGSLRHITLHLASHPMPDESSMVAAARTVELLQQVRSNDIVIACVSGGSSSLFVSPVPGVSLADKAATSRILLTCGANIIEINAVRKHLSTVKGGQLIKHLPAGTHVVNLTVSDVIGDPLDYITDPTVPDTSTFEDARATLDKYNLWSVLPHAVTDYLRLSPAEHETAKEHDLTHLDRTDIILQKADAACIGAAEAARRHGLTPMILSTFFEGESSALGRTYAAIARQILLDGNPLRSPCVLIGGGETIVTVNGPVGEGGPNQEFVASAALDLAGVRGVVVVGLDTDGTDGPTRFAGGMVDGFTTEEARQAHIDLHTALRSHNISPALESIAEQIVTGATGTNVNDLKFMVVAPEL